MTKPLRDWQMKMDQTTKDESPVQSLSDWQANLAVVGEREGFFQTLGDQHSSLFIKRGKTLIVTFENLDHVYENTANRMPWGYSFVEAFGWSMLGMMAHDWTWYRDASVYDFFDKLKDDGFFQQFDKVVFYGASMGAYAAASFSSAAPGATVICISPQATLDRSVASWETRYRKAWRKDFNTHYGYAPDMVAHADKVHIFFDPLAPLDAMHASLFRGNNVVKYKCRFMGHRIASLWLNIGILKDVVTGCIDGDLSEVRFYQLLRGRRESPRYQKETLDRLMRTNHKKLLIKYCEWVLNRRRAPKFRKAMNEARAALAKPG